MQPATDTVKTRHYRAIWISDVHLGTAGCRADHLLDFSSTTNRTISIWWAISLTAGS
jgi:hypothetical protein